MFRNSYFSSSEQIINNILQRTRSAVYVYTQFMKKEIKLLCSDIDGTLLNAERYLSEVTVSAFAKANLPIILASSRMPSAMRYLQEGLSQLGSPLIAYNGGLILGRKSETLQSNTFSTQVLEALIPHHNLHSYNLSIYSYDNWFTDKEDPWSLREINNTRVQPEYQESQQSLYFLQEQKAEIHKLMCMGNPSEIDSIVAYLYPIYGEEVHLYRSKDSYLEITPKHIDKAKALEALLKSEYDFGLEAVMAFGDNHNDDELIRRVGLGVAVANATDLLKGKADYVSLSTNKEDAVAKAILKFL